MVKQKECVYWSQYGLTREIRSAIKHSDGRTVHIKSLSDSSSSESKPRLRRRAAVILALDLSAPAFASAIMAAIPISSICPHSSNFPLLAIWSSCTFSEAATAGQSVSAGAIAREGRWTSS